MKLKLLLLASALVVVSCDKQEASVSFTEAEKKAALGRYLNCLKSAAKRLDDGLSDASTIGTVVAAACRDEGRKSALIASSDLSPRARTSFMRMVREGENEIAIDAVLAARSN